MEASGPSDIGINNDDYIYFLRWSPPAAIDKVAGLLVHHRLVTAVGPGAVGKTRLADEVLKRAADRFAEGVWVVELAAVQDPELVPAAVATVLGLRTAAGVPLLTR